MLATQQGSFRLFGFQGIQVYLHWSWFLVAVYQIQARAGNYSSLAWNAAEYGALFLIVLLHEFGHSLACRQVGGQADTIVLWPLGGVAFVNPPPRAGAELWSIAAGPLVNVVLYPILLGLTHLAAAQGWAATSPDFLRFLDSIFVINFYLLLFNILPVYPLDGGQILRSLLWFPLGRVRSLYAATVVGFIGIIVLVVYLFRSGQLNSLWTIVMAYFLFTQCLAGFRYAQALRALERAPGHAEFACPACHKGPPRGATYTCLQCQNVFDPFATAARCPKCSSAVEAIPCLHCGTTTPLEKWTSPRLRS